LKKCKKSPLWNWFHDSESKEGKPGWVNVVTGGTCASDEPGEGTPKCVSSEKRESMKKGRKIVCIKKKEKRRSRTTTKIWWCKTNLCFY
jgi:hypothetical protein